MPVDFWIWHFLDRLKPKCFHSLNCSLVSGSEWWTRFVHSKKSIQKVCESFFKTKAIFLDVVTRELDNWRSTGDIWQLKYNKWDLIGDISIHLTDGSWHLKGVRWCDIWQGTYDIWQVALIFWSLSTNYCIGEYKFSWWNMNLVIIMFLCHWIWLTMLL